MKLVDRKYVEQNKSEIIEAIKAGKIFIYPTDTIYGLGCDATNTKSVQKIREIKKRETKPFSIIVPSKEWIIENCKPARSEDYSGGSEIGNLNKYLPGPYTLIVNKKTGGTLGVRIPKHWFTQVVTDAGMPFITTSVNFSGEPHMEKIEDVKPEVLEAVDYVVYEGEKRGKPSEKIVLTKEGSV
ncbi:MAG: hypothetical protein A2758_00345 [Candidatus Zambryskibacteria bacterium RIFCSPHIGHO2_01_FULL_49_18]|uniref:L-threonylcarbamoyladenylate synthase n=2 Tax=Candidatus Zambryskiibacteriota TaxID=1817925 RepID=A0A1G2T2S3_9BACT|nr:MAG: hypothetical protein A2758_00345 [Candidatus Zambryskibacteria bacterium RIFCSPHIGHO2_01_FULL_49_18]OHB05670.1 MAG: hypothetical protein A3A26_02190 [Candidatus Zambryskibacteria bacterium RIFCSPLOWO2_01_FULL_47_14]